jgi:Protein of unknown function (DUF1460)
MKKAINYISLLSVWMLYAAVTFNPTAAPEDEAIFQQKLQIAQTQSTVPAKALEVMRSFLGTPYVYASLEGNEPEALVVNLRGLDCWTSVENCVAIALTANDKTADFNQYKNQLRSLRYWGGTINGYGSRIRINSGASDILKRSVL